jgi:hypothetical protein
MAVLVEAKHGCQIEAGRVRANPTFPRLQVDDNNRHIADGSFRDAENRSTYPAGTLCPENKHVQDRKTPAINGEGHREQQGYLLGQPGGGSADAVPRRWLTVLALTSPVR